MDPNILTGEHQNDVERVYKTPAPDFELSRFELEKEKITSFDTATADILFLEAGRVTISDGEHELELKSGEAAIALGDSHVVLTANSDSSLYRATVPD